VGETLVGYRTPNYKKPRIGFPTTNGDHEHADERSDVGRGAALGYESESDLSDLESLSSLSELSDREVDILFERERALGLRSGPGPAPLPSLDDEPEEFERDPWNAVTVVGLRVYYKISPDGAIDGTQETKDADHMSVGGEAAQGKRGDDASKDDKEAKASQELKISKETKASSASLNDDEVVKLRVVRPWLLDDDEAAGGAGPTQEELDRMKEAEEEAVKTAGLDVDDSAKDATLEGDPAARKKSIVPEGDK